MLDDKRAQTTRWTGVEGRPSKRRLEPIIKGRSCYRCVVSSVWETRDHQKESERGICVIRLLRFEVKGRTEMVAVDKGMMAVTMDQTGHYDYIDGIIALHLVLCP